jgi:hypothetical protein
MRTCVIASALAVLLAAQAVADIGTLTIQGTGGGTLGGIPFEGIVSFQAAYDTNAVVEERPNPKRPTYVGGLCGSYTQPSRLTPVRLTSWMMAKCSRTVKTTVMHRRPDF